MASLEASVPRKSFPIWNNIVAYVEPKSTLYSINGPEIVARERHSTCKNTDHSYPQPTVPKTLQVSQVTLIWKDPNNTSRIRCAKPLDPVMSCDKRNKRGSTRDSYLPTGLSSQLPISLKQPRLTTVNDADLLSYPYKSVGRLYLCHQDRIRWVSAFYIGTSRIMTTAHALQGIGNGGGIFVPAMVSMKDIRGRNYGCYPVRPHPHQHYDTSQQHKTCTLEVEQGFDKNDAPVNIDEALKPISFTADIQADSNTTWTALGYPYLGGKLTRIVGTCVTDQSEGKQVVMDKNLLPGMSGGPWILGTLGKYAENVKAEEAKANGCHVASMQVGESICSISPYFSKDSLPPP